MIPSAIRFKIKHGYNYSRDDWFVEIAIQSNNGWRNKTIFGSETRNDDQRQNPIWSTEIRDERDNVLHIQIRNIDKNGTDVRMCADYDYKYKEGIIFKRTVIKRNTDDGIGDIDISDAYKNNAEKYVGAWGG